MAYRFQVFAYKQGRRNLDLDQQHFPATTRFENSTPSFAQEHKKLFLSRQKIGPHPWGSTSGNAASVAQRARRAGTREPKKFQIYVAYFNSLIKKFEQCNFIGPNKWPPIADKWGRFPPVWSAGPDWVARRGNAK